MLGICVATIEGGVVCHQEVGREATRRRVAYPEIVTHTPDYRRLRPAVEDGNFAGVAEVIADSLNRMQQVGARLAIIPSNTIHAVLREIESLATLPVLSIADVTVAHCRRAGFERVGLLATSATRRFDIYGPGLSQAGIEMICPDEASQSRLNSIIGQELVRGIFADESCDFLRSLGRDLGAGVDALILGCTELPIVMNDDNCGVPTVDTTRLLAREALARLS